MDVNKIKYYDSEINEYMNFVMPQYLRKINIEKFNYSFVIEKLLSLYFILDYISSKSISIITEKDSLLGMFSMFKSNLIGIYVLLSNGRQYEANIILRSILELYFDCLLIFENDTEERIRLYSNYEHIIRWKHLEEKYNHLNNDEKINIYKNSSDYFSISEEEVRISHDLFLKYKDDYHPKNPFHWAYKVFATGLRKTRNPNYYDICKYLGDDYLDLYLSLYTTLSIPVHGHSIGTDYFKEKDRNVITSNPKYNDNITSTVYFALQYVEISSLKIMENLKKPDLENIKNYINIFMEDSISVLNSVAKLIKYNENDHEIGFNSQEREALNLMFFDRISHYLVLKIQLLENLKSTANQSDKEYFNIIRIYVYSIMENLFAIHKIAYFESLNSSTIGYGINISKNFKNHLPSFSMALLLLGTIRDFIYPILNLVRDYDGNGFKNYNFLKSNNIDKYKSVDDKSNLYKFKTFVDNFNKNFDFHELRNYFQHRLRLLWIVKEDGNAYFEKELYDYLITKDKVEVNKKLKEIFNDTIAYEKRIRTLSPDKLISVKKILQDITNKYSDNVDELFKLLYEFLNNK
ncbi:MAG: DUF5677 domain-containing protein [Bacteroidetes bacterium]|nr:DUF5677 domain-containing protein [Bacteroidota bacterium]